VPAETRSEQIFRRFCRLSGWCTWRVRTRDTGALRRPDFVVWRLWHRAAVEVKQIDPNPRDQEQARRLDEGLIAAFGGEPGARLRDAIKDASAQLKSLTRGRWPGLVVLSDNTGWSSYVDAYHNKTAMHGLEQLVMERTGHTSPMSRIIGFRFGPKRRLTETTGTAVSAVCRIYSDSEGQPRLDIFHNIHASSPLQPRHWSGPRVRHFFLEPHEPGQRQEWVERGA
jgi:hypothetical protein